MEESDIRRLGVIIAIQTEVEAMKLDNLIRISNGESPAYSPERLLERAELLKSVAGMPDFAIVDFAQNGQY